MSPLISSVSHNNLCDICIVIASFLCMALSQQAGASCGSSPSNTWCWYKDMDLSTPFASSFTQNVFTDYSSGAYLYAYFTPKTNDCLSPTLTMSYELIDNSGSLNIYDSNDQYIISCNHGKSCGSSYACLSSYNLGYVKWLKDSSYFIRIIKSSAIDAECGHALTVNADITINCAASAGTSVAYPTKATQYSQPTQYPRAQPTQYSPATEYFEDSQDPRTSFSGYSLLAKGYNIFTAETSGNDILENNFYPNVESWTNEGALCEYSSLEFDATFSSYAAYANSDSSEWSLGFATPKSSAFGSLSKERSETKQYSSSSQVYIYTMNLKCIAAKASLVSYDELQWSSNFVKNLALLPTHFDEHYYDVDDLNRYINFWEAFGTHFIRSAKLGGSIKGALVVDKCNVEKSYSGNNAYQNCLNGEYAGAEVGGCWGSAESETKSAQVSDMIINQKIVVKGGDTSKFSAVFNSFRNKINDFDEWISDLSELPYIVGGDLVPIHEVIKQAIEMGNHQLNNKTTENIHDSIWFQIANALQSAYNFYSEQLSENAEFGESECRLNCDEGTLNEMTCVCNKCDAVSKCCHISSSETNEAYSMRKCVFLIFHFLLMSLVPCV